MFPLSSQDYYPQVPRAYFPRLPSITEEPLEVPVERNIVLNDAIVKTEITGNSIIVRGGQINGVRASHNIKLTDCIAGNLTSDNGGVHAINCQKLGGVSTRGKITLINCQDVISAWSRDESVDLKNTNINFSVHAQGDVSLVDSKMKELSYTIFPGKPPKEITNCVIGTLHIKRAHKKNRNVHCRFIPSPKEKKIFDILLTNCIVNKVIFDDGVDENLILVNSRINNPLGGLSKTKILEQSPACEATLSS